MPERLHALIARAVALGLLAWGLPSASPAQTPAQTSARPGDDFYGYANADWLRTTPLPEGRSSYDTPAMLRDQAAARVREFVEAAAAAPRSAGARRVGDFYASWMNTAGIEAKGIAPLAKDLAAIAAIRDRRTLSAYLGRSLRVDDGTFAQVDGPFGVWIHQGFHDPDHYAVHLVQGGLGLPERDDYLDPAPEKAAARDLYRAHVATILGLARFDHADARAARVLALETAIARSHASQADTDDVFKTDNAWRRADFAARAPGLDWSAYFKAARLDHEDRFVVWQPPAVIGAAALVGGEPLEAWKDYLAFRLIEHYSPVLPAAFGKADAEFQARLAGRAPAAPDRPQQALAATNAALGQEVGRLYVARYFPPRAKAAAQAMAETIRSAFRAHIEAADWMSAGQRQAALAKLAEVKVGVGYPDAWTDYSALVVRRGDALGNLRRAEAFAYGRELAKLSRPVDPSEWGLQLPQKPGAVINFSPNALQFSAALLQPPFFDAAGDAAANYGSAGAGMAHEISHSFDELGALYDARGRLVRWWTADDLARYRAATAPMAAQMGGYCPRPNLCLKGQQVLTEAVADLAGLRVAYDAYRLSLGGKPDTVKDGLTGDQRFFLAFARRWRRVQTEAALRQQVASDSHAPGEYRADTVRNLEAWARAFEVTAGDRLYLAPPSRLRIW